MFWGFWIIEYYCFEFFEIELEFLFNLLELFKIDFKIGSVVLLLLVILELLFLEILFVEDELEGLCGSLVLFVIFVLNSCFFKILWSCLNSCFFIELKVIFSCFSCEYRVILSCICYCGLDCFWINFYRYIKGNNE